MTNIEKVARDIADALGDNFDYAFESKSDWTKHRGETPAGFRDVNQPYKPDYIAAAIAAMQPAPQEPVAIIRFDRETPGQENEMPKVISCNWMPDGEYPLYAGPTSPKGCSDAE